MLWILCFHKHFVDSIYLFSELNVCVEIFVLQRTASSSSLASSEANPSEIKVEASFIDFDSVPEPPTVPQAKQVATDASSVQLTTSSGNDWANFDAAPEVKTYTAPLNSVESMLSELSFLAPSSGPSAPVGSQGSSLWSSSGSTAPPSVPASLGAGPPLPTVGDSMLTHASTGGQWPAMNAEPVFPGGIAQPVSQVVTPVIGGSSSNKVTDVNSNSSLLYLNFLRK